MKKLKPIWVVVIIIGLIMMNTKTEKKEAAYGLNINDVGKYCIPGETVYLCSNDYYCIDTYMGLCDGLSICPSPSAHSTCPDPCDGQSTKTYTYSCNTGTDKSLIQVFACGTLVPTTFAETTGSGITIINFLKCSDGPESCEGNSNSYSTPQTPSAIVSELCNQCSTYADCNSNQDCVDGKCKNLCDILEYDHCILTSGRPMCGLNRDQTNPDADWSYSCQVGPIITAYNDADTDVSYMCFMNGDMSPPSYVDCSTSGKSCNTNTGLCEGGIINCVEGEMGCCTDPSCDAYNADGNVYRCQGNQMVLNDTCTQSCTEYSTTNAACTSNQIYYCTNTTLATCHSWSGTGTPPSSCYATQSECESKWVYCLNNDASGCLKRLTSCSTNETLYTTLTGCSSHIGDNQSCTCTQWSDQSGQCGTRECTPNQCDVTSKSCGTAANETSEASQCMALLQKCNPEGTCATSDKNCKTNPMFILLGIGLAFMVIMKSMMGGKK